MAEENEKFIIVEADAANIEALFISWLIDVLERNNYAVVSMGVIPADRPIPVIVLSNQDGALFFLDIYADRQLVRIAQHWPLAAGTDLRDLEIWKALNDANIRAKSVKFVIEEDLYSVEAVSEIKFLERANENLITGSLEGHWRDFVKTMQESVLREFLH